MKLVLGGAQFGLNYGVTNIHGQVTQQTLADILVVAAQHGIAQIDTAPAYGDCESVLGQLAPSGFEYISKVSHCDKPQQLEKSVLHSLAMLRTESLHGLLFHNETTLLTKEGQALLQQAQAMQSAGLIKNIGVSFYTPELVEDIVNKFPLDFIQCPVNLLDQRFTTQPITSLLAKRHVKLHARSIFLQGLLVAPELPTKFQAYSSYFKAVKELSRDLNCSPLSLALAIAVQNSHIDKILVGCCAAEQLIEVVNAYQRAENLKVDMSTLKRLACKEQQLINPTLWPI
ncbi:aldo/keto reductase [Pseudoalteromonas fenneropenaei]|uniref:Aldo/keto reductase n=1 Tax=Pseudoalteromonas fenneropenaei TaxID=1737459 RepID=A0ABV7CGV9_9GAMM